MRCCCDRDGSMKKVCLRSAIAIAIAVRADLGHAQDDPEIHAPAVLESSRAEPPDNREVAPIRVLVELDANGAVVSAQVESDDEAAGQAALEALTHWRFSPARRGDQGFPSRIRVQVEFAPPLYEVEPNPDTGESEPNSAEPDTESDAAESDASDNAESDTNQTAPDPNTGGSSGSEHAESTETTEQTVEAAGDEQVDTTDTVEQTEGFGANAEAEQDELRAEQRAAGDVEIDRDVIEAAPRSEGAEILRSAPGVYIARIGGDSVGHRIMLRGFDAEHGQDLELRVGHLPVNIPNHIHGQGYADLGFLIPEVVRRMRVREGVSDPRQGDFAVAGSVDLELGVEKRGLLSRSSYGSFGTFRQMALWAPEGLRPDTFAAVQIRRTDGFGQNRNSVGGSSILQYGFGERDWRFRVTGIVHGTRARTAGVLRRDDVNAGRVGFYDVYNLPTATAQNGFSSRAMVGFSGTHRAASGATGDVGVWLSYDVFRLQQNWTGFTERSETNPDWVGRGDLVEQQNRTASIGLHARYRSHRYRLASWLTTTVEAGLQTRTDIVSQYQGLVQAPQNETWDERIDAGVRGTDIGVFADLAAHASEWATLRVGARADALFYEIDDELGNRIPDFRADTYIVGYRRSAFGIVAGPRTSLAVRPTSWLNILASYGEGFRSPQARILADGETAPYTKVRGGDLGVSLTWDDFLDIRLSGYMTRLSDDIAFEPREGRLERIGASRRRGFVGYLKSQPASWMVVSSSLTFVDAELLEPPPATAEDPQPAFEEGQNLPYVPPWVFRLDAGAHGRLATLGSSEVRGRVGVGYTHLSSRPLPFGASAKPINLFDASASIGWGPVSIGLEIYNLLDSRYAALELSFPSHWDTDSPRSRLPTRHLAAGAPRTVMATLELRL